MQETASVVLIVSLEKRHSLFLSNNTDFFKTVFVVNQQIIHQNGEYYFLLICIYF
jgi:hypothetical protein